MSVTLNINGRQADIKVSNFPAGEVNVRIGEFSHTRKYPAGRHSVDITVRYESDEDLMTAMLLKDASTRMFDGNVFCTLHMPYMPYARQDRVCNPGEAFSLKVAASLINFMKFDSVQCYDLHSDVAAALIDNLTHYPLTDAATMLPRFFDRNNTLLVSPDAGANKKVFDFAKKFNFEVVRADKIREVSTGKIIETKVYTEHVACKDFLIVDDICDGGRTFIELAKALRHYTEGKVYLYVTHGIFSAGMDVFDGLIDGIFVANLMNESVRDSKLITCV